MIKKIKHGHKYFYSEAGERKVNEIIEYLNAEEEKKKKILDKLNKELK